MAQIQISDNQNTVTVNDKESEFIETYEFIEAQVRCPNCDLFDLKKCLDIPCSEIKAFDPFRTDGKRGFFKLKKYESKNPD